MNRLRKYGAWAGLILFAAFVALSLAYIFAVPYLVLTN